MDINLYWDKKKEKKKRKINISGLTERQSNAQFLLQQNQSALMSKFTNGLGEDIKRDQNTSISPVNKLENCPLFHKTH